MIRAKPTKQELDREGDGDRREGDAVADQNAQITIHADVAGYRHLWLEQAR